MRISHSSNSFSRGGSIFLGSFVTFVVFERVHQKEGIFDASTVCGDAHSSMIDLWFLCEAPIAEPRVGWSPINDRCRTGRLKLNGDFLTYLSR
jgi:hypothetical protein